MTDGQTDRLILARRPNQILMNKKKRTCHIVDYVVTTDYRVKVKEGKVLDYTWGYLPELKKVMEHESDCDTNQSQSPWKSL